jgi:hypothetical protein
MLAQKGIFCMTNVNLCALITGASSGIGAAYAHHLAARGYQLLLIARRRERLETLAATIRQRYHAQVEVFGADLSRAAHIEQIERRITERGDIDILVNNAGFGTSGPFAEILLDKQLDMIEVHVLASVRLCHAVLPAMIARQHGAIINVASIAAFLPGPGGVTYSATKRYLVTFSETLHAEVAQEGLRIQALCPGFTYSEFHDTSEYEGFDRAQVPQKMWMTANEVVVDSLKALERNQVTYIPGWRNRLLVTIANSPTTAVLRPLLRRIRRRRGQRGP